MLDQDIIKSFSSSWSSLAVLLKKKDGSTRFYIDYRKLNTVTKKDSYPLPHIDDALNALSGSKHFSTLDLRLSTDSPLDMGSSSPSSTVAD